MLRLRYGSIQFQMMHVTANTAFLGLALILSLTGTTPAAAIPPSPQEEFAASLAARAAQPWLPRYDPTTDWNFTHAAGDAQQACLRSAALPIPRADLPATAQASRLASCNSEALYYGFTGKPDYVRARECAYLERAAGDRRVISGSAVLSMIYADGLGAKRDLPMATKFACEAGGAPAEIAARVEHIRDLAGTSGQAESSFDFCDDITSGYMEGVCTAVAAAYRDARRNEVIARIASRYTPTQRAAFAALQKAAAGYFDRHAMNEVDLSGTARGAFWIEDIEHSWNEFLRDLQALEADEVPRADTGVAQQGDARLSAIYQQVLAEPSLRQQAPGELPPPGIPVVGGTISREGIRSDHALWLAYRDEWLHFAAVRKPALPPSTVQAWITGQRVQDLRCLLPSDSPGAVNCTRPSLLPSNMRQ